MISNPGKPQKLAIPLPVFPKRFSWRKHKGDISTSNCIFNIQAPYKEQLEQPQWFLSFKNLVNKLFTITWQTLKISSLALLLLILTHISSPQSAQRDFVPWNAESSFGSGVHFTLKLEFWRQSLKNIMWTQWLHRAPSTFPQYFLNFYFLP